MCAAAGPRDDGLGRALLHSSAGLHLLARVRGNSSGDWRPDRRRDPHWMPTAGGGVTGAGAWRLLELSVPWRPERLSAGCRDPRAASRRARAHRHVAWRCRRAAAGAVPFPAAGVPVGYPVPEL